VITLCSETPAIDWASEKSPDSEHLARTFLQGERSLAAMHNDEQLQETLDAFLNAAGEEPLLISSAATGEIMLEGAGGANCLVLDGRTADVLSGYLRGESVSAQDRMDMTVRSRK
jgi:hypothetical protein